MGHSGGAGRIPQRPRRNRAAAAARRKGVPFLDTGRVVLPRTWVHDLIGAGYRCSHVGKWHVLPNRQHGGGPDGKTPPGTCAAAGRDQAKRSAPA